MKSPNNPNKLTIALLVIYLIALAWIIVLKFGIDFPNMGAERSINLIPYSRPLVLNGKANLGEIILNVLIFIPLGLYVGVLFRSWSILKKIGLFFLVSLVCEVTQFILAIGAFDVTDLINNTSGGIIGLTTYLGIEGICSSPHKARRFINVIGIAGTASITGFLLFLKINQLWIFRM